MASITWAEVYRRAMFRIGSRIGTVLSGNETSAVLGGLVSTTGDDLFYQADRLIFPLATVEADKERFIEIWTDQTGEARFQARSVADPTDEQYILANREDYTLAEIRNARDSALSYARRSYRQVIPLTPNLDLYPLVMCDWLQGAGDIDSVWINESPLLLHNEDFALWQEGASAVPDGYTLEGTGAAVSRLTSGTRSVYRCQLTGGGAAVGRLTQAIPASLSQWLTRRIAPVFTPLRAAAWLQTTTASNARVFIRYVETSSGSPVTTYLYSDYATATGVPQFLTCSLTPSATMQSFEWGVEVTATHTCQISAAVFMQNTQTADLAYSIRDQGSQAYYETEINLVTRNVGGLPTVEIQRPIYTPMQLIVYVRRPFPVASDDTDLVDDQYARVLEYGLLNFLLRNIKPQQDRSRLDEILYGNQRLGELGVANIWARYLNNIIDRPVPKPPVQRQVRGA